MALFALTSLLKGTVEAVFFIEMSNIYNSTAVSVSELTELISVTGANPELHSIM